MKTLPPAAALLILVSTSSLAFADEAPAARAERLFKEAKALVSAGHYAEACPSLEESERLDPALGTEYNLADCYEHTRRPASALALFRKVEEAARDTGKKEREESARARASALAARAPTLTIFVKGSRTGVVVKRDGAPVPASAWGRPQAVDYGEHAVEAESATRKHFRQTFVVDEGHAAVDAIVPELEPASVVPSRRETEQAAEPAPRSSQRTIALVVGGAGVVGVAVGAVFGAIAIGKHGDATTSACPHAGACADPSAVSAWSDAQHAGTVSTVAFALGGVALAAGAVLWLTAPRSPTAVGLAPSVGRGAAALGLHGAF